MHIALQLRHGRMNQIKTEASGENDEQQNIYVKPY